MRVDCHFGFEVAFEPYSVLSPFIFSKFIPSGYNPCNVFRNLFPQATTRLLSHKPRPKLIIPCARGTRLCPGHSVPRAISVLFSVRDRLQPSSLCGTSAMRTEIWDGTSGSFSLHRSALPSLWCLASHCRTRKTAGAYVRVLEARQTPPFPPISSKILLSCN